MPAICTHRTACWQRLLVVCKSDSEVTQEPLPSTQRKACGLNNPKGPAALNRFRLRFSSKTKGPGEGGASSILPQNPSPKKGPEWCSVLSIGVIGKSAPEIGQLSETKRNFWMISWGPFLSRPLCSTADRSPNSKNSKRGRRTGVRQSSVPLSTIGTRYGNSASTAWMPPKPTTQLSLN